jgi:hypothetical protein
LIGACHQAKIFVDPEKNLDKKDKNKKKIPGLMADPFA